MRVFLGGLLLSFFLSVHAANSMAINVDSHTKQFVIKLAANPTTGYQWTVKEYDKKLLNLSSSQYVAPDKKLIGAGGEMLFTFTLNKAKVYPKCTQIMFNYARPWDPKSGTLKQVTVKFIDDTKS